MEPVANGIWEDKENLGFGIKERVKISLFIEYTLVTTETSLKVMEKVKLHLKEFGEITGITGKLA